MKGAILNMERILLVIVILAAWTSTDPRSAEAGVIEGLVHPSVLPLTGSGWNAVPQADRTLLIQAWSLSDEQVDLLVQSDDPLDRGLAIYLLDGRGDLRRLLDARALLGDNRPTIPEAAHPHSGIRYAGFPTTVAGYLRFVYQCWFGVEFWDEQAVHDAFIGVENLDHLVRPWVYRFRRAEGSDAAQREQRIAEVKQRVAELPPDIRWVVAASMMEVDRSWGGEPRFYSDAEAAAIFQLAAAELGGHIDPEASPAWTQPGLTPDKYAYQKVTAVAMLRRIAPNVIAPEE